MSSIWFKSLSKQKVQLFHQKTNRQAGRQADRHQKAKHVDWQAGRQQIQVDTKKGRKIERLGHKQTNFSIINRNIGRYTYFYRCLETF